MASEDGRTSDSRLIGVAVLLFAAILWFWAIPAQVDTADYGWMRPRTLPQITTVAMALFGLGLLVKPAPSESANPIRGPLIAVLVLVAIAVWAIGQFGFVVCASPLAFALALFLGERRWSWLVASALIAPFAIWGFVILLGRPLP